MDDADSASSRLVFDIACADCHSQKSLGGKVADLQFELRSGWIIHVCGCHQLGRDSVGIQQMFLCALWFSRRKLAARPGTRAAALSRSKLDIVDTRSLITEELISTFLSIIIIMKFVPSWPTRQPPHFT